MESEAPVPNSESCIGGVAGVATSPVYLAGVSKVGRGTGEVGIAPMVTHTTQGIEGSVPDRLFDAARGRAQSRSRSHGNAGVPLSGLRPAATETDVSSSPPCARTARTC